MLRLSVFHDRHIGFIAIVSLLSFVAMAGCARNLRRNPADSNGVTRYSTPSGSNDVAVGLNREGLLKYRQGKLDRAEALFRQALDEDISFGPAHNNLGQLYLDRHQLYLAAWEFEYAANLMPSLAEPLIGKGLAYESGEQLERALEIYENAYERFPGNPLVIASLARARIKLDRPADEIGGLLDELIMLDGRQDWVAWAKELRQTKYRINCMDCYSSSMTDPRLPLDPQQEFQPERQSPDPVNSGELDGLKAPLLHEPINVPSLLEELPSTEQDFGSLLRSSPEPTHHNERDHNTLPSRVSAASFETLSTRTPVRSAHGTKGQAPDEQKADMINFGLIADELYRVAK
ncbi:hypothetical protein U8335_13610 [Roseiconus lacunae]|uniref:tetratricopeptide repeat protein n=1 Tax=Roseiconus lacunae TaxID=2605694 RepID=UPI0030887A3B|nr:hypothetical protein U8335_13610 [Stieleria sp. HD01]